MGTSHLPLWWQGIVTFEVTERSLSQWLPAAQEAGHSLRQLQQDSQGRVRFQVAFPEALPMLALLRRHGVRVRVGERSGWPPLWQRLRRRWVFWSGALLSFCFVWLLSSIIWWVDIEGTDAIQPERVRELLVREGVYRGQFRSRLPDLQHLVRRLRYQLPDASWVGIRFEGTRLVVAVVEKRRVAKLPVQRTIIDTHGNLVAKQGALVTELLVERGNPLVDVQEVVKAGQILIAGFYGDAEKPEQMRWVGARGRVMGEVWYAAQAQVNLQAQRLVYTGRKATRFFPYVHKALLRFPFLSQMYPSQRVRQAVQPLYLGPWELPTGWVREEYWEVVPQPATRTLVEAVQLGRQHVREVVQKAVGLDGRILTEKVLHQRLERGKVVLSMHLGVTENIAVPQSTQQGE